jgi:hypothetical protein
MQPRFNGVSYYITILMVDPPALMRFKIYGAQAGGIRALA